MIQIKTNGPIRKLLRIRALIGFFVSAFFFSAAYCYAAELPFYPTFFILAAPAEIAAIVLLITWVIKKLTKKAD